MSSRPARTGLRREASIDVRALAHNIADRSHPVLDGRAAAYGFGIDALIAAALIAGCERIAVSTSSDADRVSLSGLVAERADAATLDPDIYGFDDSRTVLTLSAEIVATKRITAGTGVSYGYTYRADEPTNLALVSLGFADGIPRRASNGAAVSIDGARFPIVGRIAMDQFVVATGDATPAVGDDVVLFGEPTLGHPSAQEWADAAGLTPWQLTAGLGPRIARTIAEDSDE